MMDRRVLLAAVAVCVLASCCIVSVVSDDSDAVSYPFLEDETETIELEVGESARYDFHVIDSVSAQTTSKGTLVIRNSGLDSAFLNDVALSSLDSEQFSTFFTVEDDVLSFSYRSYVPLSVEISVEYDWAFSPELGDLIDSGTATYTVEFVWTSPASVQSYTVSYNSNGGSGSISSVSVDSGDSVTLPSSGFIRSGYTLTGWTCNGQSYDLGDSVTVTSDMTFSAVWTQDVVKHSVTYMCYGPSSLQTVRVAEGSYELIDPYVENPNHTFSGWLSSVDGQTYQPGDTVQITSDVTFTGQWTGTSCIVTFDSNGGSEVYPMTVPYGTAIGDLPSPVWEHHDFIYWYYNGTFDAYPVDSETVITEDMTLTAIWQGSYKYVLDFNADTDLTIGGRSGNHSGTAPTTPVFTDPEAYVNDDTLVFDGWYLADENGDYTVPFDWSEPYYDDIVLQAHWTSSSTDADGSDSFSVDDHLVGILAALAILFVLYLTIRSGRSFRRR